MKRLYNEYSAELLEGSGKHVQTLMINAFQRVWDEVVISGDVCPRDTEAMCHAVLSGLFAENRLRRAVAKRNREARNGK